MTIEVEACFVYPLKAAAALEVESLRITALGPQYDRRWLLVRDEPDRRGVFITQRDQDCEKLALIKALPTDDDGIRFDTPAGDSLQVDKEALAECDGAASVWDEPCRVLDAGEAAARWFSDFLGMPCRLVKMDERFPRPTDPAYSQPGDQVSFADSMPLLVTNRASLDALNARLGDKAVGMDRFRPNLVLRGAEAFEEDVLHELRIGDAVIELVLPCARCKVPTIDQTTGRVLSKEPVATLIATRRGASDDLKGIFFGQNALPRVLGSIRRGDRVEILSTRPMHPALKDVSLRFAGSEVNDVLA
ncbi:MAG: MOSC N-terminal beta barrel domain-containing protein [Pseudomonadota bacterium]